MKIIEKRFIAVCLAALFIFAAPELSLRGSLLLGPENIVEAGGSEITVPGYSVPSTADWNNDGLDDLIVGEGGLGTYTGKVRIYLNQGIDGAPSFGSYFYPQSEGTDLERTSGG